MFARVFAIISLGLLVAATPIAGNNEVYQCNTGSVQCCNQLQSIDQSHDVLQQYNLVAAALQAGAQVGLTCSPATIIGVGSGCQVSQQPVCCSNNQFNGVVNIGCTPANVQL